MKKNARFGALCAFFVVFISVVSAEDIRVDREELAGVGNESVKFINYVGPHEFINTLDQIRDIGRALGSQIDRDTSGEASVGAKYRVLHIVNPDIPDGLDADIFILEPDAAVDHINNLRTIIAGYLETLYGFSSRDAYLVAEFVTYYNAVYRGDMDMARERYKAPVVEALDAAKMGLDTHYSNWAGKTQMLIPLRGDDKPKIDTAAITDEEVIEEMREEDDKGLDSRRDMVDLIEEELDEEQKDVDQDREELDRQEEKVVEEIEEIEEKEDSGEVLTPEEQERKEELEEERETVEREKEEVEERQQDIDERTEEVMKMREDIAEDENALMEEADDKKDTEGTFTSAESVIPVWFLMVDAEGDGIPYGRVVKYDLEDGERLAVSDVTAVRGRTIVILPDNVLVIAGKEGTVTSVRPMLLDCNTLEIVKEGVNDVFPGSLMTVRGSDIYLVTLDKGEWRLGRFDAELSRKAVSEAVVEPWTSLTFDGDSLFVQSKNGEIIKLSASDLVEEDRLE